MHKLLRVIRRILLWALLTLLVLVMLLSVSLYIPVVQDWVCQGIVTLLNSTSDGLSYDVGSVRLKFPLQLQVNELQVTRRADDHRVLRVGRLQTALDGIPHQESGWVFNSLSVSGVEVGLDSLTESIGILGTLGSLSVKNIEMNLDSSSVKVRELMLRDPDFQVSIGPSEPDTTEQSQPWSIDVQRLLVSQGNIRLDLPDEVLPDTLGDDVDGIALADSLPLPQSFDYHHLALSQLNLEAEQILYNPTTIGAQVNHLTVMEQNSGLELRQLTVGARMAGDRITLEGLDLQLADDDYLRGRAVVDLSMAQEHPHGLAEVQLAMGIDSVNLVRLASPYLPQLRRSWVTSGQSRLEVDARMTQQRLELNRFWLRVPQNIELTAEGRGTDVLDNERRSATLSLRGDLWRVEPLLTTLVAQPTERDYRVPDSLAFTADATQQGCRVRAALSLRQDARPVVRADASYDIETEAYLVQAETHRFNVSDFVPSVMADLMTLRLQAEGRHFDPQKRSTRLAATVNVDSLYYMSQTGRVDSLQGVSLEASLLDGNYLAEVHSSHPTLSFNTRVEGCYLRDTVSAAGYLDVLHADMAHLPYLQSETAQGILSLRSHFDVGYDWADNSRVRLTLDTLSYDEDDFHQHFPDIIVTLDARPGNLTALVTGGDARLSVHADCGLTQLPTIADTLLSEITRQSALYRPDFASLRDGLPAMSVELDMARQNPFIQALERQTGLTFDRAWLHLRNDRELTLTGEVHNYLNTEDGSGFDTVSVAMHPADVPRAYDYWLHAQHHDLRPSRSYNVHASGRLLPDSLTAGLTYVDGRQKTVYDVLASLALADDTATLRLEKGPTLYEQPFTVNADNYIRLMQYRDLEHAKPVTKARLMMDGPRDLKINLYTRKMPDHEVGNQLLLLVRNLDLDYASQLMEWEGEAAGNLNLTTAIDIFPDSISGWMRTGIGGLRMGEYHTDTLTVLMNGLAAHDRRDLDGSLSIDGVERVGFEALLSDSIQVQATVDELPMALLGAFMPSDMQFWGKASGSFTMQGKDMEHAQVGGGLWLREAGMNYTDLNASFTFPDDTLRFARNRLLIRDYNILAANQNPITLRGLVDMSKNVSDPAVSLTIKGENVRIINNRKLELRDQYLYGRLPVSTNIAIKGTASKLSVTGNVSLLSGTDLHYFMQDDPLESSSKVDKLVEFVSFNQIDRMIQSNRRRRRVQTQATTDEGMNMELKINLANDVKVKAHLAGTANNSVVIVGGAGLTLSSGSDGRMLMDGVYNVTGGEVNYKLPILPLVKTFGLKNSSTLVWQGVDPGNPVIDLKATEEVKTTVNDDAGSRVVKFLVTISIKGTLDALDLTFDCDAPEDGAISTDIASLDADERSKAALMLLVAQTYIGPGNSSSMGLGTANAALNSMLNREMDSMLSGMKHTNIDLGIDTYNTGSGNTRTNYSVKVSQNFFNDRFRATIGGQVSSGGDAGQSTGARLGDMSLEWLIKKDGSHLLKLFRTTNYESVLEGELIETGVSYVQERSAFRLKQLFIPTSRKRQLRMQQLVKDMQAKEEEEERAARRRRMQSSSDATRPGIQPAAQSAQPTAQPTQPEVQPVQPTTQSSDTIHHNDTQPQ